MSSVLHTCVLDVCSGDSKESTKQTISLKRQIIPICHHDVNFLLPVQVDDDRLGIVKELLRSEDTYLENLRNIFDIYMEPLK